MKEHITWQSLQKIAEKKRKKNPTRKKERKEFNDHPVRQRFLCWLNSWMLLVKERRNCLTGLNLWAPVPGTPLAAASSQCFSSRSWAQLSPTRCHRSRHLCCRGEEKGRSSLLTPCGISFWPEAQVGYSQSIFACPAPSAVNEHEAPRSSGK